MITYNLIKNREKKDATSEKAISDKVGSHDKAKVLNKTINAIMYIQLQYQKTLFDIYKLTFLKIFKLIKHTHDLTI